MHSQHTALPLVGRCVQLYLVRCLAVYDSLLDAVHRLTAHPSLGGATFTAEPLAYELGLATAGSSLVVSTYTLGGGVRLHTAAAIASVCMGLLSRHSQYTAPGVASMCATSVATPLGFLLSTGGASPAEDPRDGELLTHIGGASPLAVMLPDIGGAIPSAGSPPPTRRPSSVSRLLQLSATFDATVIIRLSAAPAQRHPRRDGHRPTLGCSSSAPPSTRRSSSVSRRCLSSAPPSTRRSSSVSRRCLSSAPPSTRRPPSVSRHCFSSAPPSTRRPSSVSRRCLTPAGAPSSMRRTPSVSLGAATSRLLARPLRRDALRPSLGAASHRWCYSSVVPHLVVPHVGGATPGGAVHRWCHT